MNMALTELKTESFEFGTALESFSAQIEASMEQGRSVVAECGANLRDVRLAADRMARERPWSAVLGALVVGVLCGMIYGQRR